MSYAKIFCALHLWHPFQRRIESAFFSVIKLNAASLSVKSPNYYIINLGSAFHAAILGIAYFIPFTFSSINHAISVRSTEPSETTEKVKQNSKSQDYHSERSEESECL
jgi:hypothetical protein